MDTARERIVPPAGHTAWLTSFTAGAMAFLAVFAMALALASGRLADRWSGALSNTATIRVSAPTGQTEVQADAVLAILETTPGVAEAHKLTDAEQLALLAPWFGADLPVDRMPIPRLIAMETVADSFDAEGLRQRLTAETPGAVLDDHGRWRAPLVVAAGRLRMIGVLSVLLIGGAMAAMITLAANAALASNAPDR